MAKQYKVKDINNNGKIDGWEQGKYDAINNSATKMYKKEKSPMKMGYAMKMGKHSNVSPTNFKTKDAMLMAQSLMYKGTLPSVSKTEEQPAEVSGGDLIKQGKELKKQGRQQNRQEKKSNRKEKRVKRLEKRKELQEFKGKKKLDEGNKVGAYYKQKRIDRINKRITKNK